MVKFEQTPFFKEVGKCSPIWHLKFGLMISYDFVRLKKYCKMSTSIYLQNVVPMEPKTDQILQNKNQNVESIWQNFAKCSWKKMVRLRLRGSAPIEHQEAESSKNHCRSRELTAWARFLLPAPGPGFARSENTSAAPLRAGAPSLPQKVLILKTCKLSPWWRPWRRVLRKSKYSSFSLFIPARNDWIAICASSREKQKKT